MVTVSGGGAGGTCERECLSHNDCSGADDADGLRIDVCDNEGRCVVRTRPPDLRIFDPENDTLLASGTRTVSLSGTVGTAAAGVIVTVRPSVGGCSSAEGRSLELVHPEPGRYLELPFLIEDVRLDPGVSAIVVAAAIDGARREITHYLEVPCGACAQVTVTEPIDSTTNGLVLPRLAGTVSPTTVRTGAWRVRSANGEVIDGRLDIVDGYFLVERLPLFPGANQIEVAVSGDAASSESRCSRGVTTPSAREHGLRTLLSWEDRSSDLDLHIVLPGGQFGDPAGSVSPATEHAEIKARVTDAFEGPGPEVGTIETVADGVYGFIVVPVFDLGSFGTSAFVRLLFDGRLSAPGPVGPAYLSPFDDSLWVVGKLVVAEGRATWVSIDQVVPRSAPPTTSPDNWPERFRE